MMSLWTSAFMVFVSSVVTTLWVCALTTAATTASVTSTTLPHVASVVNDEGVCSQRYLNSDNSSQGQGQNVVGIAVILELHRPLARGCGEISGMELQTTAALFWAVNRLNGDGLDPGVGSFIPGVRTELRVYDDCSDELLAARHIGELLSTHQDFNCTPSTPPIAGILGTSTSHTTTTVASLLSNTKTPQFGISATVSVLSDNHIYPTFFRTIPSDLAQSKVLLDLVQQLQWTYVVGIYTKDNYGTEGFQEFKRLAAKAGVCVFEEESFRHSDKDVEDDMERFVRELLIKLGNTRFSSLGIVFFGHDTEAAILFQMIKDRRSRWHRPNMVDNLNWLFSDGVGISPAVATMAAEYSSRLISISPATSTLHDVREYFFHVLDNPQELGPYWQSLVTEYLQNQLNCFDQSAPVENCQLRNKISAYDYLPAALDSLYSLVTLVKRAHESACGGKRQPGVCQNMSRVLEDGLLSVVQPEDMAYSSLFSPERLPSQFRAGRVLVPDEYGDFVPTNSPLYFINSASNGKWSKIGEYRNGSLTFGRDSDLASIPRSECGTDCQQCRNSDSVRFTYLPGDIIIVGLYSISTPASPGSFTCGDYRNQSSSVAAMLAFLHTLEMMSSARVKFGALVLDDCYNKLTVSALLTDLFSGKTTLRDPATGLPINMAKVVAVIGSQSSSVTLSALSLLTPLRVPSISYSATSPDLDDRLAYPYFLRPVPSDSLQARALVDLVLLLNVTYVGALHQNNNYGMRGMQQFVKMAEEEGICVETSVAVDDGVSEITLHKILRDIKNKDASVVVVFVVEATAITLLDAIQGRNLDLVFLASEAWGVGMDTLQGQRGMTARGSLVLTVDTTREAGGVQMADYLRGLKTPDLGANELPWMRDFWENEKRCNLPGGFSNDYGVMCDPDVTLSDAVVQELAKDQKVVQTINAVASVITALNRQCRNSSDPAKCMLALSPEEVTRLIMTTQLLDQNQQPFRPYLDNGNGNIGFTVNNVQKMVGGGYNYVKVGHYDPTRGLQLDKNIVFYDLVGQPITSISSSCQYKLQCSDVCGQGPKPSPATPGTTTAAAMEEQGQQDQSLIAAVCVLALVCAVLLTVLVAMVCCARRRGKIPFLGVVKRDVSRGTRASHGEANMGFVSTSPRASLPSSTVPLSSMTESTQQYNDPSDLDTSRSISRSSGTPSSNRATSSVRDQEASHYDYTYGQNHQRRPKRPQFQPQQPDARQQVKEQTRLKERLVQQVGPISSSQAAVMAARDRPRARSEPRVDRPLFLPASSPNQQRQPGPNVSPANRQGTRSPLSQRPRAKSHDAGLRGRLGALSEDDQMVLFKYLSNAPQQNQLCAQTEPKTFITTAEVESATRPAQRPTFFLSSLDNPTAATDHAISPDPVFPTSPSVSSSCTSLSARPTDDSSLLYLHAIPSEQDLYLEVLAEPTEEAPLSVTSTGVPPSSPPFVTKRSVPHSGAHGNSQSTSLTSPVSPLTSVPGSATSESSGAVFISPIQECRSFNLPVSKDTQLPNTQQINTRSVPLPSPQQSQVSPLVATKSSQSVDVHLPNHTKDHNRVLSPNQLQQLLLRHSKSPSPSASEHALKTSPPSTGAIPGVLVRSNTGDLFWVPNVLVPLNEETINPSSGSPVSTSLLCRTTNSLDCLKSAESTVGGSHMEKTPVNNMFNTVPRTVPQTQSKLQKVPKLSDSSKSDISLNIQQQTPVSRSPVADTKSRRPKMGVDSLSVQRKMDGESQSSNSAFPRESSNTFETAGQTSPKTLIDVPSLPDTGQQTHSPGRITNPGGIAISKEQPKDEGIPYIQSYQLLPLPSPCHSQDVHDATGSGSSNHTSGDSGTGEDLNIEPNPARAVCV